MAVFLGNIMRLWRDNACYGMDSNFRNEHTSLKNRAPRITSKTKKADINFPDSLVCQVYVNQPTYPLPFPIAFLRISTMLYQDLRHAYFLTHVQRCVIIRILSNRRMKMKCVIIISFSFGEHPPFFAEIGRQETEVN